MARTLKRTETKVDLITDRVATGTSAAPKQLLQRTSDMDERFVAYYEATLPIISTFETGRTRGYDDVTPDFDGQGLSVGLLGWNIGKGSLRPLLQSVGRQAVKDYMPKFGDDFWRACFSPVSNGLQIVRNWQLNAPGDHAKWNPEYNVALNELREFLASPLMKSAQKEAAKRLGASAWLLALDWAKKERSKEDTPTLREFATFYDALVQNGSMKGLTHESVKGWLTYNRAEEPTKLVCTWLARVKPNDYQAKDAALNSRLWDKGFPKKYEHLLLLHWLRAQQAYGEDFRAQGNVVCRRGTILANNGYIGGQPRSFDQLAEP